MKEIKTVRHSLGTANYRVQLAVPPSTNIIIIIIIIKLTNKYTGNFQLE